MKILVTGSAGFIGFHLSHRLLSRGDQVMGVDNLNNYYDVMLKKARLQHLMSHVSFQFVPLDLNHRELVGQLFREQSFDCVVHLAAQAGVRYSLTDPFAYLDSNLLGFGHVLEGCRQQKNTPLIFASSSSVYGLHSTYPFKEDANVDHPISLYAATKKANELMAHSYAHLYRLPCTGLRFFTVYGPWGRPDMALFAFTQRILSQQPIDVFNYGNMSRDFTYIDDIIDGVLLTIDHPLTADTAHIPYRIYNIGSHCPIRLTKFITILEKILNQKAIQNLLPMQPGDVAETFADITQLKNDFGYEPKIDLETGVRRFVQWYMDYYGYPRTDNKIG